MAISDRFVLREVAGERTVLPLGQSGIGRLRAYQLSEDGAALWRLLERGATMEELVTCLRRRGQDDDPEGSAQDFVAFLEQMGALV